MRRKDLKVTQHAVERYRERYLHALYPYEDVRADLEIMLRSPAYDLRKIGPRRAGGDLYLLDQHVRVVVQDGRALGRKGLWVVTVLGPLGAHYGVWCRRLDGPEEGWLCHHDLDGYDREAGAVMVFVDEELADREALSESRHGDPGWSYEARPFPGQDGSNPDVVSPSRAGSEETRSSATLQPMLPASRQGHDESRNLFSAGGSSPRPSSQTSQ